MARIDRHFALDAKPRRQEHSRRARAAFFLIEVGFFAGHHQQRARERLSCAGLFGEALLHRSGALPALRDLVPDHRERQAWRAAMAPAWRIVATR
jgi:hypothetical protein